MCWKNCEQKGQKWKNFEKKRQKNMKNQYIDEKKFTKNRFDNQGSYKKV